MNKQKRKAKLHHALLTVLFMVAVMFTSIVFLKATPHIPLILGCGMAGLVAVRLGYKWDEILAGMIAGITDSLEAILILLLIGTLVGTWIAAGTVPTIICFGLRLVSSRSFLPACMLVCLLVAVAIGSWGTVGTIGLAFMGIGLALGLSPALVAGSIISGAYMGEVISPLSDATNLAAAVVGKDVLSVVKKTGPAALCAGTAALILYAAAGMIPAVSSADVSTTSTSNAAELSTETSADSATATADLPTEEFSDSATAAADLSVSDTSDADTSSDDSSSGNTSAVDTSDSSTLVSSTSNSNSSTTNVSDVDSIQTLITGLQAQFHISPLTLLPMAVVIICILAKLPAIPSMLAGSLAGALIAIFVQGKGAGEVLSCACSGFVSSSGNEMIDRLLSAGGLQAMMESVSIIILAMSFGGIMRKTGQMEALVRPVTSRLRRDGSLSAAVVLTCFLMNFVLPDQYLSISMPGQIYADSFDRRGISRERLGAVILGGGAVTSPLVPWNTCGIYCMTMLSVPTFAYAPFVFFGLLLPVVTILFSCFTHRREFSRSACQ